MQSIEVFHHEELNITSFQTEDGARGGLLGEIMAGPYRKARDHEAIPGHLTDLTFYDAEGNLLIPAKLFGP